MHKHLKNIFIILTLGLFLLFPFVSHGQTSQRGGIIVETSPTVAQELLNRAESSWPWYVARASGLIAAVLMVLLLLSGVGFITGSTYKFLDPITAWATHRALGIVFGIMLILHVGALYFDSFVPFNFSDLLIPFQSSYKPISLFGFSVGSLYVAFGVIALYLIGLIILTSLLWMEKLPKTWKVIHIFSYLVIFLVFIHAIYLGTDLAHGVLRFVWIALGVLLLGTSLARLWRAKTI